MNYNLAKHLIGKIRFTELKLPRIRIRNHRKRMDPDPYQNETDPQHWFLQ